MVEEGPGWSLAQSLSLQPSWRPTCSLGAEVCPCFDWLAFLCSALKNHSSPPSESRPVYLTRPQGPSFSSVNDSLPCHQSRHAPDVWADFSGNLRDFLGILSQPSNDLCLVIVAHEILKVTICQCLFHSTINWGPICVRIMYFIWICAAVSVLKRVISIKYTFVCW